MKPNDRFAWALSIMDVQPNHQVLEIGCGVGLTVEQIVPLLKKGSVTAIDRSRSAIEKAIKRNAAGIADNKVEFLTMDLLQLQEHNKTYDKIFSFNVNFFWTKKTVATEATILKSLLKKNGLMYLLYGPLVGGGVKKIEGHLPKTWNRKHLPYFRLFMTSH